MCKSICSSIKCYIFCSSWCESVATWWKQSTNLSSYTLDNNFTSSCISKSQPRNMHIHKSQHETILADLNWYTAKTSLVIILMDDAIKYTCFWPLAWHNKYKSYNSSTPLQWFLTFLFTSQREREAMKDERTYHDAMDKS